MGLQIERYALGCTILDGLVTGFQCSKIKCDSYKIVLSDTLNWAGRCEWEEGFYCPNLLRDSRSSVFYPSSQDSAVLIDGLLVSQRIFLECFLSPKLVFNI